MKYFKKLVGERIYLSPINPDDLETYTEYLNDLETGLPIGQATRSLSLAREKEILERMTKEDHTFAIIRGDGDEERMIGNCDLYDVDHRDRRAMLGIFIGDHASRGKGYGTEAIKLLLEYGFGLLNLENIMLTLDGYNQRGIRCYEKCGFKIMGRRRSAKYISGVAYDIIYMDILREDFSGDIRNRLPQYFREVE